MNVLLVGGWVDQAFTFVRAFSQYEPVKLYVADEWPDSACKFSRHVASAYTTRPHTHPDYVKDLLAICEEAGIDVVLPVHHEDLMAIAPQQHLFRKEGVLLPISDANKLTIAVDKYLMAQRTTEAGIRTPGTWLGSQDFEPRFPVLGKLRSSTGQRGQCLCHNQAELRSYLAGHDKDEVIICEYIPGSVRETMYSVGLLYDSHHRLVLVACLKKIRSRPYTGGTCVCAQAERHPAVEAMAVSVVETLGDWVGIANVEVKLDPRGRPVFIELNPRPWGCMWSAYVAGLNFPVEWLLAALGKKQTRGVTFVEGACGSFLARDIGLLKDIAKGILKGDKEAWRALRTYTLPYPPTSDFVLSDLRPFWKNLKRFL